MLQTPVDLVACLESKENVDEGPISFLVDLIVKRVILDKIGNWPTRCFKTILRALVFWNAGMACTLE